MLSKQGIGLEVLLVLIQAMCLIRDFRALEDVSRMKGRVLFIAHSNSLSNVAGVWDQ